MKRFLVAVVLAGLAVFVGAQNAVPADTFTVRQTLILTALDNERIQIDTASQTWNSDLRGLASAQGRCERSPA
jgi:hypothetical protein